MGIRGEIVKESVVELFEERRVMVKVIGQGLVIKGKLDVMVTRKTFL